MRWRFLLGAIPGVVFLMSLVTAPISATPPQLQVHFIDVGQGDSCWLHLPNGDDVLVEGGKPHAGSSVVAYLQQHGVDDMELMVATRGHTDHIGGLLDVLGSMHVDEAWLDLQNCATQTCSDFYQALADHGVLTATVRRGETYTWGDVTALVLNPSEPLYPEENENSPVLRISHGSVDLLLTGDAETGAEGRILGSGLPLAIGGLRLGASCRRQCRLAPLFRLRQPPSVLEELGQRLRRVRIRYHKPRGLGLPEEVVGYMTNTRKGPWRITASPPPHQ